jgi:hypothetical protein
MHKTLTDKVFITYPGGSGGDLLGATCNGIELTYDSFYHTEQGIGYLRVPPYTIKKSDRFVQRGTVELEDVAAAVPYQYLTTHLIDELAHQPVYNVVIDNPDRLQDIVYRQLILQVHNFRNDGTNLIKILKKLCAAGELVRAAEVFIHLCMKTAVTNNNHRQNFVFQQAQTLDFSDVFLPGFMPNLVIPEQRELFRHNHDVWMQYQRHINRDMLIQRLKKSIPYYLSHGVE